MKKLVNYICLYFKEEFNPGYFLSIGIFLTLSILINYTLDIETNYIYSRISPLGIFAGYLIFYSIPLFFSIGMYALFYKKTDFLKKPGFWILSIVTIFTLSFQGGYNDFFNELVININSGFTKWADNCGGNLFQALLWFIPPFIYWIICEKKTGGLYGLKLGNAEIRPYFIILLMLLPFVAAVSFKADFLSLYPRFHIAGTSLNLEELKLIDVVSFEFFYGMAFVSVEFLFRGFIVLAFSRYLGKGIIVPMAVVYCFIHFQKPLIEAVSSIFGGMILGVIAYETGMIYGGIIAHLGIAWMMEIFAFLQYALKQ